MTWQSARLVTPDGAELQTYSQIPKAKHKSKHKAKPKAIIQINHGMAEHAARYERFAGALAEAGYATFAHDTRGHGHTKASAGTATATAAAAALGMFARKNGWDAVIGDVAAVNGHIAQTYPNIPIVTFGHSMGSIVAFNYALRLPKTIAAAALWNSGVETGALALVFSIILKI